MSYYNTPVHATGSSGELNTPALLSFIFAITGNPVAAIICGHVGRAQIKTRFETGGGWALAGLIIGYIHLGIIIIVTIIYVGLIATLISSAAHLGSGTQVNTGDGYQPVPQSSASPWYN